MNKTILLIGNNAITLKNSSRKAWKQNYNIGAFNYINKHKIPLYDISNLGEFTNWTIVVTLKYYNSNTDTF